MKNSVESLNTCIIKRASICKLKAALFTSDGKQEAFDSNINDSLRGTTPTEDVDVGDCVLEMKLDFILCDETLNKDLRLAIAEWNSETMEPASKIDKDLTLVVQLMHELYSENSVWKSYVDSLPTALYSPVFWDTNSDLELLYGSSALPYRNEVRKNLDERFQLAIVPFFERYSNLFLIKRESLELDYRWAVNNVLSRAFLLESKGSGLVPLADMANHSNRNHGIYNFDEKDQVFRVVCIEPCRKGEEFLITYGSKSNDSLLVEYGFIIEDNIYNHVSLEIPSELMDSPIFKEREFLLKEKSLTQRRFELEMSQLPIELLLTLRILLLSPQEFYDFSKDFPVNQVSVANERKVLETIISICKTNLSKYKFTFEEDLKILSEETDYRRKMLVNLTHMEKEIWNSIIDEATFQIELLNQ